MEIDTKQNAAAVRFDADDVQATALCAWKEARGDGQEGCAAVLWVIANRSWGWRQPVHDVVFGKNQFTSMSVPSDPEFNLEPQPDDALFAFCRDAAPAILGRQGPDLTRGAHYYCNPKTATSGWFARNIAGDPLNHPVKATIGRQVFYL